MRRRAFVLGLILAAVRAGDVPAQAVADTAPRSAAADSNNAWLFGASVGVPGYEDEPFLQLFTVGIHGTHLRGAWRPGFDYSLGTMPRALGEGVFVLGFRGGVAVPLELSSRALLLPSAGLSLIGGAGEGGAGGTAGLNAGVAAIALGLNGRGLRTGVTWHRFQDSGGAIWLVELGVVGLRGLGRYGRAPEPVGARVYPSPRGVDRCRLPDIRRPIGSPWNNQLPRRTHFDRCK
jgi:hypothetical protein